MPKPRHKIKRFNVSVNQAQLDILEALMMEDLQTDVSAYFGLLILGEHKRRTEERTKRGPGRPRKDDEVFEDEPEPDYTDDLPKIHTWFNKQMGAREYADTMRAEDEKKGIIGYQQS